MDEVVSGYGFDRHYYGWVSATLSEDLSQIVDIAAELTLDYIFEGQDPVPVLHSLVSAEGLPLVSYYEGTSASWRLLNEDACAATTEMQYEYFYGDWVSTGYSCENSSYNYVETSLQ